VFFKITRRNYSAVVTFLRYPIRRTDASYFPAKKAVVTPFAGRISLILSLCPINCLFREKILEESVIKNTGHQPRKMEVGYV
jgi:hypothetical protein